VSPVPYVPLDARGWRLAMGLRPLDLSQWLELDEYRDEELALKTSLLADHRDEVVALQPEGDDASQELLEEIRTFLATNEPRRALATESDDHPLIEAARLVQEDLCVLVKDDAWRLRAACVCFPSRWDLSTKIGTTLNDIHAPVPGYDVALAHPTNAFFDRLTPERSFWRLNWTLLDSPDLFQPLSTRRAPRTDVTDWYFRVERQTLRQLPRTRSIIFTIRTYVTPARLLDQTRDDFRTSLLHALESAPPEMLDYKGWVGVAERLRAVLS
jgi:hypothetical protein